MGTPAVVAEPAAPVPPLTLILRAAAVPSPVSVNSEAGVIPVAALKPSRTRLATPVAVMFVGGAVSVTFAVNVPVVGWVAAVLPSVMAVSSVVSLVIAMGVAAMLHVLQQAVQVRIG